MESKSYIWFAYFQRKHNNIAREEFMAAFSEKFDYELRNKKEIMTDLSI